MEKGITYVGLDAHKVSIIVAMLVAGSEAAAWSGKCRRSASVRRMVRKVMRERRGRGAVLLRGGAVRVRAAALDPEAGWSASWWRRR